MKLSLPILRLLLVFFLTPGAVILRADSMPATKCIPLISDSVIIARCHFTKGTGGDTLCSFSIDLAQGIKGELWINDLKIKQDSLRITAICSDTPVELSAAVTIDRRSCMLLSDIPLKKGECSYLDIPPGFFVVRPEYIETDEIDIEEDALCSLAIAGAWHKAGSKWQGKGMFSVVDDDSIDGQIPSSKHDRYSYGYYSLLFPLLESLGLRGNLAVEGRKIGLNEPEPCINDNARTIVRLQDEKGWDILSHSMECLGETLNNWMVDSLSSELADLILKRGPNYGPHAWTVSVFDLKTRRQYWPNSDNTGWEETPERFIKPYIGNFHTQKEVMYNPDFSIDWHWGEWKRRAEEYGMRPIGFVTHNSTSSHAIVPGIMKVFPFGLSDIAAININRVPMLSTAVRSGLEGQSMGEYDGNSKDNRYNKKQFKKFCAQIDEAAKKGEWIIFNLHTYRDCWLNHIPGALVSEGGSYPDEWVIPMKGMDSARDSLSPPPHLGIDKWSEWYPCPGSRLEMMWKILKYAKDKGLLNVTCSEGFAVMGNKKSYGYFNQGYRFGMDITRLVDTEDIYPHYIVSAADEVFYYNPLISEAISKPIADLECLDWTNSKTQGRFLFSNEMVYWSCPDPTGVTLKALDLDGNERMNSDFNKIDLHDAPDGLYVICAMEEGRIIGSVKLLK